MHPRGWVPLPSCNRGNRMFREAGSCSGAQRAGTGAAPAVSSRAPSPGLAGVFCGPTALLPALSPLSGVTLDESLPFSLPVCKTRSLPIPVSGLS